MKIYATPNEVGQYRVYGYGTPPRIWIAVIIDGSELNSDTRLRLTDSEGNTEETTADMVIFDHILKSHT